MADQFTSESYLREEIIALREEGFDTSRPQALLEGVAGAEGAEAGRTRAEVAAMLGSLPRRSDFHCEEPSDLAAIRAARPDGPRKLRGKLGKRVLADRTLGAWLGRAAGCLLGKPCEGWSRERIEKTLRAFGEWPLSNYWPSVSELPAGMLFFEWGAPQEKGVLYYHRPDNPCLRGNIKQMARDDDMDYPIIGLHILERFGPQFTTANVGQAWLDRLPYHQVYTAERVAYRNLVDGLEPPATASYRNPYREWIGAQIRADIMGWVCPGLPELAAELAFRDATLSHVKNGIYGEMFFAALLAAAFVESDLHKLIEIGLSEIPRNCRLREAVLDTVEWCDRDPNWETTWDRINAKYGHYHGVHTINNAAVVLMGLLHAKGDYEKAIGIAVMGGWDTDCNGATAGAVMGVTMGAKALPPKWIEPLHDRISSIVIGYTDTKLSSLAKRTGKVQEAIRRL
ncbi:MAG: ADP-ribosylglycohydrolase family protein [Armatimonadota bacterium]